jgi:hypothetical protein
MSEATSFDHIVAILGLGPDQYKDSLPLKEWVRQNKDEKYVPTDLLKLPKGQKPQKPLLARVPTGAYYFGTSDCSRSAAISGVMSRCGVPSISKPTINLRTVAERSNGG